MLMKSIFLLSILIILNTSTAVLAKNRTTKYCYDKVWRFHQGLAKVSRDGKFGFIDTKGNEVIECKYHWVNNFSSVSHLASFTDTLLRFGYMDTKGNIRVKPMYSDVWFWDRETELVYVKRDGKFGFLNANGVEVIPCVFEQTHETPERFYNGMARMRKGKKYGIIDIDGNTLIDFEYDYFYGYKSLEGFPSDILVAKKGSEYYYIDMETFKITKSEYELVKEFTNGMAAVQKNNLNGFINSSLELVVPCVYVRAKNFNDGLAVVQDGTGKWGYVNKSGKNIIDCQYKNVFDFNNGRALVSVDSLYGVIDKNGHLVMPFLFDYNRGKDFSYKRKHGFNDGLCAIRKNDCYGIVDTLGVVMLDFKYDYIWFSESYKLHRRNWDPTNENYALAKKNGIFEVIDKSGNLLDNQSSSHMIFFVEGISYVCDTADKCAFIRSNGEWVTPYDFEYYEYSTFYNGFALVKQNGKFGIINNKGKIIVNSMYDDLSNFSNNLAKATLNGNIFFINQRGKTKLIIQTE